MPASMEDCNHAGWCGPQERMGIKRFPPKLRAVFLRYLIEGTIAGATHSDHWRLFRVLHPSAFIAKAVNGKLDSISGFWHVQGEEGVTRHVGFSGVPAPFVAC